MVQKPTDILLALQKSNEQAIHANKFETLFTYSPFRSVVALANK